MKQKLRFFILTMLFFTTFSYAQIKVWDFGAEALDPGTYTNMLDVATINAFYPAAPFPGVANTANILPSSFSNDILSWSTAGTNDRLRTSTAGVTCYDTNVSGDYPLVFTGRVYVNSSAKSDRFLQFELNAGEEITIIAKTDSGGTFNFEYIADPSLQHDMVANDGSQVELHFIASQTGSYKIYDSVGKPSYYRVYLGNVATVLGINDVKSPVSTIIMSIGNRIYVSNVKTSTEVKIYSITGALVKSFKTSTDTDFTFKSGLWIASLKTNEGQKAVKLLTY